MVSILSLTLHLITPYGFEDDSADISSPSSSPSSSMPLLAHSKYHHRPCGPDLPRHAAFLAIGAYYRRHALYGGWIPFWIFCPLVVAAVVRRIWGRYWESLLAPSAMIPGITTYED